MFYLFSIFVNISFEEIIQGCEYEIYVNIKIL